MADIKAQLKSEGNDVFPNPNFVGIDTDNIIANVAYPFVGNYASYTATEDCFIQLKEGVYGSYTYYINNVIFWNDETWWARPTLIPLKKGQTFKVYGGVGGTTQIKILAFGLKY